MDVHRGSTRDVEKERSSAFLDQTLCGGGSAEPSCTPKPANGSAGVLSGGPEIDADANAAAQGSRLMALLRSQEQHLLVPGGGVAAAGHGAAGAASLGQAHALLMQSLVGSHAGRLAKLGSGGPMSTGGSSTSHATEEHQRAVQQLATRLKGPGDGPDTVRWGIWSCAADRMRERVHDRPAPDCLLVQVVLERVLGQGGGGTVYKGVRGRLA